MSRLAKNTVKRIPAAPSITRWSNDRIQRHIRHGLQTEPFHTDSICNLSTPKRLLLEFIMRIKLIPLKLEMMKQASYSELTKTSTALARLAVTCVLSAARRLVLI